MKKLVEEKELAIKQGVPKGYLQTNRNTKILCDLRKSCNDSSASWYEKNCSNKIKNDWHYVRAMKFLFGLEDDFQIWQALERTHNNDKRKKVMLKTVKIIIILKI